MSIKDRLKKEGKVTIDGATLMYIANVLRDHQTALMQSIAEATVGGASDEEIGWLEADLMANEVVGGNVLRCIKELIGKELYEKFLDGRIAGEAMAEEGGPIVFTSGTGTLN